MFKRSSVTMVFAWLTILLVALTVGPIGSARATALASPQKLMMVCNYGAVECGGNNGLTAVGNRLFFLANDGVHGQEVWVSDGTPAGTYMVKDIFPGETGLGVCSYCSWSRVAYGNKLLFGVTNEIGTRTLWISDGSAAGTQPVVDLNAFSLFDFNGLPLIWEYMATGTQLSRSDGTADGTTLLKLIPIAGYDKVRTFADDSYFYILFIMPDPEASGVTMGVLWRTDGTPEGTIQVAEIPETWEVSNWVSMNGSVFFVSNYMPPSPPMAMVATLWKSNGSPDGTQVLATFPYQGVISIMTLAATDELLFFAAKRQGENPILWQSDGTPVGTVPVADSGGPYYPGSPMAVQNKLFFQSANPIMAYYVTEGKSGGIDLFADWAINNPSHYQAPVGVGNVLYYLNSDDAGRDIWWRTDGVDKVALMDGSAPYTEPTFEIAVGTTLLFTALTPGMERELWISGGTPTSTRMLLDLPWNQQATPPAEFTRVSDKVFFTAPESNKDVGLWVVEVFGNAVYLPMVRR